LVVDREFIADPTVSNDDTILFCEVTVYKKGRKGTQRIQPSHSGT
jgi:hypothetical protein